MRETLKLFTNNSSLQESSEALLAKMGIKYSPLVRGVPFDDYFKQNGFNFRYIEELENRIEHIWNIGYVNPTTFQGAPANEENAKYFGLSIFACEIKPKENFTRSMAVALTRAFNRASTQRVNNSYDMPVIVIIRQGSMLSLATCERSDRQDGHGEKVGKVTILRDMNCKQLHAGHKQILERISNNVRGCKSFEELHQKWFEAFNIKILSKQFFEDYKAAYEDIVEYVTGKRIIKIGKKWEEKLVGEPSAEIMEEFAGFENPEKAVRDYVKNLMGRLVFIQFLQKKGWMGVPAGEGWHGGDPNFLQNLFHASEHKDDFVDKVLEPLFKDLNTCREDDLVRCSKVHLGKQIKVPYLNGGLFDVSNSDSTLFKIPSKFFWNNDESEFEKSPGILRLFSNYNFTIDENAPDNIEVAVDPEMLSNIFENLLEENKDKGAFYTPKEIVESMCRESLIAYLQTDIDDPETKQSFRNFVLSHEDKINNLKPIDVALVKEKLRSVKICDPAIGSGAFPMGMLKELFECRMAIDQKVDKRDAIEIKKDIIQNSIYGVDIEKGAVDIARLRFWLSLIVEEDTPHALPNMDFKIMQGNSLLEQYKGVRLDNIYHNDGQTELAFNEETAARMLFNEHIFTYFKLDNHEQKLEQLEKIDEATKSLVKAKAMGNEQISDAIEQLDFRNNSDFFLWHTWFSDVFATGGFDIVIGNPPYFVYEGKNKGEIETLKKIEEYKIALGGKLNAYKLFLAHALNCLVKKSGIVCYIFQNSFMADMQAVNLRKYVINNCQILSIDSFPERDNKKKRVFESVKMSVCILLLRNKHTSNPFIVNIWDDRHKTSGITTSFCKSEICTIDKNGYSIPRITEELKPIIIKMLKKRHHIIECNEGELNVTSHREYFSTDNTLPIIMKGAGIQRYYYTFDMSQGSIEYLKEQNYLNDLGDSKKAHHHNYERVVMQGMTGANDKIRLVMTIIPKGIYLGHSCKYIMPIPNLPIECILAIMNSKIANTFFRCFSTNSNVNGYEVEYIPIPKINESYKLWFIKKVQSILCQKQNDYFSDTTKVEHEIDRKIYELYGLTNAEVKIIDPDIYTTGVESELFKA